MTGLNDPASARELALVALVRTRPDDADGDRDAARYAVVLPRLENLEIDKRPEIASARRQAVAAIAFRQPVRLVVIRRRSREALARASTRRGILICRLRGSLPLQAEERRRLALVQWRASLALGRAVAVEGGAERPAQRRVGGARHELFVELPAGIFGLVVLVPVRQPVRRVSGSG